MPDPILTRCPVVPVVVLDHPAQALPLGRALLAGGIDVVEVTLRTAAGLDGIRALTALPDLQVAAGSVLTAEQVDQVRSAGAEVVVSPGLSRFVLDRADEVGLPVLPGVATASDLMVAVDRGLAEVKLFPAGLLGGPAAVRALSAPFPGMTFMPSGGVGPDDVAAYLELACVPAVSGSWMVEPALLREGAWDEVTSRSAAAVEAATAMVG